MSLCESLEASFPPSWVPPRAFEARPCHVANSSPFQPAIPFEGNFRTRKEDRKQNHTHDHKELNEKEGKHKYVEHFSLDSQRFLGARPVPRPDAFPASTHPGALGARGSAVTVTCHSRAKDADAPHT